MQELTERSVSGSASGHESIEHEPLTALEQWKVSRHRSLWLVVSNWSVSKRAPPIHGQYWKSTVHVTYIFNTGSEYKNA